MIYEIQSKSDLLSGATLIIKMPEEDLDRKALYTIQEDKPDFILPFHHRVVDGQVEFVYQVGEKSKLQYLAGERYPKEYAQLWSSVLNPLFECGDWFLRPYSFVFDIKHLYCDKNKNSVSYVYIPSLRDCSDYYCLREMAADFSRQITVTDPELENKVLRAIMLDFNPKAFVQMLKACTAVESPLACIPIPMPRQVCEPKALPMPDQTTVRQETPMPESGMLRQREGMPAVPTDIFIDISPNWKPSKKTKDGKKDKKAPSAKKEKQKKTRKDSVGLFKKKAGSRQAAIPVSASARATAPASTYPKTAVAAPPMEAVPMGALSAFSAQQTAVVSAQHQENAHFQSFAPVFAQPVFAASAECPDITQHISADSNGAWFRLIGNMSLPPSIDVAIAEGEVFTVGRFDKSAGRQRSSFEFDKMTKAVSRRHAAIERRTEGYNLIDLASSAGTFIDGQKLPPNTPCQLHTGCRVSFGNCGADYIWEGC